MRTFSDIRLTKIMAARGGSIISTPASRLNRSGARSRLRLAEAKRTVEDRLRKEYFSLLPEVQRVADRLEAEVKYHMRLISGGLERYERLTVKGRVKSCESALEKLRGRQEGATFDESRPSVYTLTSLNDLAGVRVLAFPRGRLTEIDRKLRRVFPNLDRGSRRRRRRRSGAQVPWRVPKKRQGQGRISGSFDADRSLLGSGAFRDLQTGRPAQRNR